MNTKLMRWFVPRIPAIILGGAAGVAISHLLRPEGIAFILVAASALVGAFFALWIHNDVRGVFKAVYSGATRKICVWTVVGALLAGLIGLLIRRLDCQAPVEYPWLFGATVWGTWWRFASIGAVMTLLQIGDQYDDIVATPAGNV